MPLFKPQLRVDDEGVLQGYVGELDFVGATVAVVVSGNKATVTISSASVTTLYSGDGTIAGPRAVALNGNLVAFNQGAEPFLVIDPTANAETVYIRSFNTTGSDNYGRVVTSTSATNAQAYLEASFNGGAKIGGILLIADNTSARLTYTALTHTFTGGVSLVNDIDVATAGTRWGSQSFGASGDLPACALIGSFSGSVTIFPSYSSVTVGSKAIIGYWSGSARSAFEIANVASGNGVAYIMKTGGNVGIGVSATTARLHLPAGSATASTGPLKFTSGTLLGTTEAGAIEYDGTHLYFTAANAGTRYQLDQQSGGATIYSGDGVLAGNRIVDLDGNSFSFEEAGTSFLTIDPTVNNEVVRLRATNVTGGSNEADIRGFTSDIDARVALTAVFDGGNKEASIVAFADATSSTLTYTADTHTFNGRVGVGVTPDADRLFVVQSGGQDLISVSTTFFSTTFAANDGTANSQIEVNADLAGNDVSVGLEANDGSNSVTIFADAIANTLAYTADTHTVNGTMVLDDLSGTGSRAVLADATGTLSAPVSDISVKENVIDLTYGLDIVNKLRPVSFSFINEWKRYGKGTQLGFIAQEIESILPNSVFTTPQTGKMGYNETDLIPILVKAIQEQQRQIESLKN